MTIALRAPVAALGLAALLCPLAAAQSTHFSDVSAAWGASFAHKDGITGFAMGGGAAWFDLENDGDEDLLVTSSDGVHRLLRREPAGFQDATVGSGLLVGADFGTMGVIAGDCDQDGFTDLYLTNFGPNQLFRNQGGGAFSDLALSAGVVGASWSTSASFADFDRDGDLDLYVGNYVAVMGFPYHVGAPNELYVNDGAASPKFFDHAALAGVDGAGMFGPSVPGYPYVSPTGMPTYGCTLSTCTLDYDDDGDPDLAVGNDFGLWVLPNELYRNDTPSGGVLQFAEVSTTSGFDAHAQYNMGINGADYDGDGDWDFYMSDLGGNLLLRNDAGSFVDVTAAAGPVEGMNDAGTLMLTSWGTIWGDFDNDSWEDLVVVNGYIPAAPFLANDPLAEDHLWRNRHDGTFERIDPALSGMNDPAVGRGIAASDVDVDGWLDFYVVNNGAAGVALPGDLCRLYRNNGTLGGAGQRWLELSLAGWKGNREAIGARVDLYAGGRHQKRQVLADPVYVSSGTRVVHFGLGAASAIDRLELRWPSGIYQELVDVRTDRRHVVLEPRATLAKVHAPAYAAGLLALGVNAVNHTASPLACELLIQVRLGSGGPIAAVATASDTLAAGATERIAVEIPIGPTTYAMLQGVPLEQRVFLGAAGAFDCRSAPALVP